MGFGQLGHRNYYIQGTKMVKNGLNRRSFLIVDDDFQPETRRFKTCGLGFRATWSPKVPHSRTPNWSKTGTTDEIDLIRDDELSLNTSFAARSTPLTCGLGFGAIWFPWGRALPVVGQDELWLYPRGRFSGFWHVFWHLVRP